MSAPLSEDARAVIKAVLNAVAIPAARDAEASVQRGHVLNARIDLLVGCVTYLRELAHAGEPVDLDTVLARLREAVAHYPADTYPTYDHEEGEPW
ncbi:hypothetical protein ACFVH6_22270 [Spirillospora sp. NPDC127200]